MAGIAVGHPTGIVQSLAGCLAPLAATGVTANAVAVHRAHIPKIVADLAAQAATGRWPLATQMDDDAAIASAEALLARLGEGARTLVFLASGGDALVGQTMAQLAGWNVPGGADPHQKQRPRTRFYDTIDPHTLAGVLAPAALTDARYVVVDQGGDGALPLAQARAVVAALAAAGLGGETGTRVAGLAPRDAPSGGLRQLLSLHGAACLALPDGLAGATGCLTLAGLLPALARGLDGRAIRMAARSEWARLAAAPGAASPVTEAAATMAALVAAHRIGSITVVPHADKLGKLADWLALLWDETLTAALPSAGMAYAGPSSRTTQLATRPRLVIELSLDSADVAASPVGRIAVAAEAARRATLTQGHADAGRLHRAIHVARLDETTIGGLLMQLLLEAILCGRLLDGRGV